MCILIKEEQWLLTVEDDTKRGCPKSSLDSLFLKKQRLSFSDSLLLVLLNSPLYQLGRIAPPKK